MRLEKLISDLRIEIADKEQTIWESDELIRSIEKCIALMSRLIPKRAVVEDNVVRTIANESLTITNDRGTLAYKPAKIGSVKITGKTVDTDYRVNYLTGVVTEIGNRLPDGNYTVSYELDPFMLDLSTFLPDYIKIERVEYPVGNNPPSLVTFDVFGNFVSLRQGSAPLTDKSSIRIIYLGKWTPPTSDTAGDYPSHLNDVIIIGSAGQALIFKAEEYVNKSATTANSIVTLLSTLGAIDLTLPTLTVPTPPSLTFPSPPSTISLVDITHPTSPTLDTITVPTDYSFSKPTAPTLPTAPTPPTAPTLDFTDANTAMAAVATEITAAKSDLTSGRALINTGTRGENVAANYGNYARVLMEGAGLRATEAMARLRKIEEEINRYASQVTSYGSSVNAYANEISGTIGRYREQINAEIAGINNFQAQIVKYQQQLANQGLKIDKYNGDINNYEAQIAEENMKISKYTQDINNYQAQLQALDTTIRLYLGRIESYQAEVNNSQKLVEAFIAKVNKVISQATQLNSQVTNYLDIAGRYLASGQAKINEMLTALGIKPEFTSQKSSMEQR